MGFEGSLIASWIGFGCTTIAVVAALVLGYINRCRKGLRDLYYGGAFVSFMLWSVYLIHILEEGYTEVYGVWVPFARFSFYIPALSALSLMISKYLWHEWIFKIAMLVFFILTSVYALISILLVSPGMYIFGAISLVLLILGLITLCVYAKRRDTAAWVLIGVLLFGFIAHLIVNILNPVFACIISWEAYDCIILVVDCIIYIVAVWLMLCTYKSVPCDCVEVPEGCCAPQEKPCERSEYNYYQQHAHVSPNVALHASVGFGVHPQHLQANMQNNSNNNDIDYHVL